MADRLYLSLWFPSLTEPEMMPRTLSVLRQFPFSPTRPGISYVAIYPVSWTEPPVFEESYPEQADFERVVTSAAEYLHDDYAYEFEIAWDLWTPSEEQYDLWLQRPQPVRLVTYGEQFDEGAYQQEGHILVDFGLDVAFLYEEMDLTAFGEQKIKANVQKLVEFTIAVEKNCGVSSRLLWSESEENLAQKLIARLQKVQ